MSSSPCVHSDSDKSCSDWRIPYGIMVNVQDYYIVVSKFEQQSFNCIHFWTNAPWESFEPPLWTQLLFYKDGFGII